jgi:hypothetical protein
MFIELKKRNERGVYITWRQGIDPNSLWTQLAGHTTRHLEDSRLAGVIGNTSRVLSNNSHLSTLFTHNFFELTLFARLPDFEAIRMILPPFPNFLIC